MKKLLCVLMVVLMLPLPVRFVRAEGNVSSLDNGFDNIKFSNDYHGFCLDRDLHGADTKQTFRVAADTSAAKSNVDGSDISQELKILFTHCFADIFASDGNGGYEIKDSNTVQAVVWNYTEGQHIWGDQLTLKEKVEAYNGPVISDEGYTLDLSNGDKVTFSFKVFEPHTSDVQVFFAYKLYVTKAEDHTHAYEEEWKFDEEQHWNECECGDKQKVEKHTGGKADCMKAAVCDICHEPYGKTDPEKHTGETEIKNQVDPTVDAPGYTGDLYCKDCGTKLEDGEMIPKLHEHEFGTEWQHDEKQHWQECDCGEKQKEEEHLFDQNQCIVCNLICSDTKNPGGQGDSETAIPNDDDKNNQEGMSGTGAGEELSNVESLQKQEEEAPDTGDETNVGLWCTLSVLGFCGSIIMIRNRKKE